MASASALSEHLERSGIRQIGPFRLDRELGKGGFAPVFLAKELYGGIELRTVAVKLFAIDGVRSGTRNLIPSGDTAARQARDRVIDEARALCRVDHPNVVRFHQLASDPTETLFALAMEHVTGTTLGDRLRRETKLSVADTIAVGVAVASALAAVHGVGLVHRDVKPANIVEHNGVYKLIDFGIASQAASTRTKKTRVQVVDDLPLGGDEDASAVTSYTVGDEPGELSAAGTLGYMDPVCIAEQTAATAASDLYALGATLFECVTGSLPARAAATLRGLGGLRGDVIDGRVAPPAVKSVEPTVSTGLARLIDSLLDASRSARPQSAARVSAELERLRRVDTGRTRPLPPEDEGPFRGLSRFDDRDRDLYFGRTAELAGALEVLRSRGLCAIVGASGSGKSSLARAALLPAIEDGELSGWPLKWTSITIVPGSDPRGSLLEALSPITTAKTPEAIVSDLAAHVEKSSTGIVLLVDQLEELVTISEASSRDFLAAVLLLIAERVTPGVRAVVAARRDLLDGLLDIKDLAQALPRSTVVVSAISAATWDEVIDQGLTAYGYTLESSLHDEIAPIAASMPLVGFALRALWEHRDRTNKVLPKDALAKIGGVAGALERHAESTLATIAAPDVTRRILVSLTTARGTRATLTDAAIDRDAESKRVRLALEDARLLVREPDGVTLAHEALITQWKRLSGWLAEVRADRALAEEIETAASQWGDGRKEDRLLRRSHLRDAERVRDRGAVELSPLAREFLTKGRATERRTLTLAAVTLAVVLGAAIFGAVSYVQGLRERQKETLGALDLVGQTQTDTNKFKKHVQSAAEGEVFKLVTEKTTAIKERDDLAVAKKNLEASVKELEADKKTTEDKLRDVSALRTKLAADFEDLKKSCAK